MLAEKQRQQRRQRKSILQHDAQSLYVTLPYSSLWDLNSEAFYFITSHSVDTGNTTCNLLWVKYIYNNEITLI